MIYLDLYGKPFNLDHTLKCGQVFGWERHGDFWYNEIHGTLVGVKQDKERLIFKIKGSVDERILINYFSLKDDYHKIEESLKKDELCYKLLKKFKGLRILTQEPFYCTMSFICSTNANIPQIERMIKNLKQRFGEKISFDGKDFYTFPKVKKLAEASVKELRACNLGYRAKYVKKSSEKLLENLVNFDEVRKVNYERAWESLQILDGVGPKVSDCILLFSLHKLESFPLDRWIRKILERNYGSLFNESILGRLRAGNLSKGKYRRISERLRNYFGEYAGYAQEFLYYEFRKSL
ncbi:MAG: DNA glycosylase [Nitrososphaerales archaeon]